jgi:hypothetical protein
MILTKQDKTLFAKYCKQEAETYRQLAKQLKQLPNHETGVQMFGNKANAFDLIHKHLTEAHDG